MENFLVQILLTPFMSFIAQLFLTSFLTLWIIWMYKIGTSTDLFDFTAHWKVILGSIAVVTLFFILFLFGENGIFGDDYGGHGDFSSVLLSILDNFNPKTLIKFLIPTILPLFIGSYSAKNKNKF